MIRLKGKLIPVFFFFACANTTPPVHSLNETDLAPGGDRFENKRIKGVSFVGSSYEATPDHFTKIRDINANYVTLMPFAYGEPGISGLKYENLNWQWWGESLQGVEQCILLGKALNLSSMIKPQLWIEGNYTGHYLMSDENEWTRLEDDYTSFIMSFASLSEKHELEIFCIGTELDAWVNARPQYWKQLIKKIRSVYNGAITYAANWDTATSLEIWKELNYIGIDAYYPLSNESTPDQETLVASWKTVTDQMAGLSGKYNIPVIFTEWGYRSIDYCAKEPWNYDSEGPINEHAQAVCYKVFLEEVMPQPWFAGGFVWKWFPDHTMKRHSDQFSPQGKKAETILAHYFSLYP